MNNNPFVTIGIPVYNIELYLEKCLDSIVNQTYKNIEMILVDDGSTDGSRDICDQFAAKDSRIRVIHVKNGGVSRARNIAIENAQGEYMAFVDGDDYIEPDMIECLIKLMNPESDLTICGVFQNNSPFTKKINEDEKLTRHRAAYYMLDAERFGGYVCNKLYKLNILKEKNIRFRTDIHMCEDTVFNVEYLEYARGVSFTNSYKYHYVVRENSASCNVFSSKRVSVLNAYEYMFTNPVIKDSPNVLKRAQSNYVHHCIAIFVLLKKNNLMDRYEDLAKVLVDKTKGFRKQFFFAKKEKIKYKIFLLYMLSWQKKENV